MSNVIWLPGSASICADHHASVFTIVQARSSCRRLFAAAATTALRVCQFMPVPVDLRLARTRRAWFSAAQLVLERAKALADWPRAGLLSRMHTSASLTARPRTSTTTLCAQRSRCLLSSGPAPHGHCIHCSFASLGIAAFRALLTIRRDRIVGTTPAQMQIMATRVAWDSHERSMCIHIVHCD